MEENIEVITFDDEKPGKKKNNKFMKFLLVILFIILFALVGFLVYTLMNKEEKPKTEDNENNNQTEEVTHTEKDVTFFEELLNTEVLVDYREDSISNIGDLPNNEKLGLLFCTGTNSVNDKETISKEDVDNFFKKYYNITVINEDVSCSSENIDYKYNEETLEYTKQNVITSSYNIHNVYAKTVDYTQNNDKYTLTRIQLYEQQTDTFLGYYSSIKDKNENQNIVFDLTSYPEEDKQNYVKNKIYGIELEGSLDIYKDNMRKYIYTFEKIDDNFVLISLIIQ